MYSIKRNFIFNLINTLSGLLFPLISFPYSSRILLADGIGQVQFYQSIISYISLCTALGIPLYAVREIAKIRDNKEACSKVTIEILVLHSLLTLIGYFIVFVLIKFVEKIQVDSSLFLLMSSTLFFTTIGAMWFYQGIEDFRYITYRTIIVRILSLIALFLFVKNRSDLYYYASINVVAEVGSNIFNFIRLKKYIDYKSIPLKELNIKKHLKPALKIFLLNLVVSIYVNLDSVMLGFLSTEASVGYYTAATKITKTTLGVIQSLGTVLLPHFANLIGTNQKFEFERLVNKAINLTLAFSLPITVGLIFMAEPFINLFCGKNFEPSILTLQIMSPIIIFIGISGILGMQVLYVLGKENIVILSTCIGAAVNLSLNRLLIPHHAQYGAAIATVIAESLVAIAITVGALKHVSVNLLSRQKKEYYWGTFLVVIVLYSLQILGLSGGDYIFTGLFFSILVYYGYLLLKKDEWALFIKKNITNIRNGFQI